MSAWVIYRGPLERSRLSYLLEAAALQYGKVNFLWIFPGVMTPQRMEAYKTYIKTQPVAREHVVNKPLKSYLATRTELGRIISEPCDTLLCIGFSAIWFSSVVKFRRLIWCVNGIPEEKELTSGMPRLISRLNWLVCRLFRKPDLIVVVSSGMQKLVSKHMHATPVFVAPTCVDIATFRRPGTTRKYFTYLGTGAAWQALDLLSELWQIIHRLNPAVKFRVISRDPRANALANNISPANIEFVGSNDFEQVAQWLNESEAGFLVRRDNLVNRVSFPTKLAEYLAAGAWVVSSDFDWEVKEHIEANGCGVLIGQINESSAKKILQFYETSGADNVRDGIAKCADSLDRKRWVTLLNERLSQLA